MVPVFVLITIVFFVISDIIIRLVLKKINEDRIKKQRIKALDIGLKLQFADEAVSLKRVEVDNPKAKILAVDDEEIILESFRKILVLAGYSVDTVVKGSEALNLIKKNKYDFVFTDFKMPEMDGVEVTKAVKYLKPEIDVIMITGYATIEAAVETLKYGAMDFVQKPFTEDELVALIDKCLVIRQDRIEKQIKPKIHMVTPASHGSASKHEVNVPAGAFISEGHVWACIELNGLVKLGVDDFIMKIIGNVDSIELPLLRKKINKGEILFTVKQGQRLLPIKSPMSGTISTVNRSVEADISLLNENPYSSGWACAIDPSDLNQELKDMTIGSNALDWYKKEIDRYIDIVKKTDDDKEPASPDKEKKRLSNLLWDKFREEFIR
jgi:CheY-like chemotaxis protein